MVGAEYIAKLEAALENILEADDYDHAYRIAKRALELRKSLTENING